MAINANEIADILRKQIAEYGSQPQAQSMGTVTQVGDGIAQVHGLSEAMSGELVEFGNGTMGLVLNLELETVGIVILGGADDIREGDSVRCTGRIAEVPVGEALLGRTVDALGRAIDGKGPITASQFRPVERVAPGITARQSVNRPLQTGLISIDSIIPIGRGQRELIIGDRQTGKTAIAIDTIINQRGGDVICIYVGIGQKLGTIAQIVGTLAEHGALDYTIVISASASDPAPLQYLAPYAGCAIGEEFMEQGRDVLIVYDDLSKHAWAYRQLSLLLRRPPGREAYPGDVFYLHSRLLERSARLSDANGGGSLTALPIIETLEGNVAAYIPTNVISITDGQIYLEGDLFYAGIRPAVNVGLSVSRVGGSAQTKAMKRVAGRLRNELAQYRELAAFAQFSADLDKTTRERLDRGNRITEILKQPQYQPMSVGNQVALLFAVTSGFLDDVPLERVREFRDGILQYLSASYSEIESTIVESGDLTEETSNLLRKAIEEYKSTFMLENE